MIKAQVKLQERITPGMWVPRLKALHATKQLWKIEHSSPDEVIEKLVQMTNDLGDDFDCWVHKHDTVYVNYLTKKKWLDQAKFTFTPEGDTIHILAECSSTGLLPMSIPCAPILNMFLFAFPFADHGMTARTLKIIRKGLQDEFEDKEIVVEEINVV